MKIILSNYTDLGNPSTPKGLEPEWLGVEFHKRDSLSKVICRGISTKREIFLDKKYIVRPIPFGNKFPLIFSAINKYISDKFPARYLSHNLFDYLASKHIKNADVLCCGIPSLNQQMRKAKKKKIKCFLFATSSHVSYTNKLYQKEYKKYGLSYINQASQRFYKKNCDSYDRADLIFARSEFTRKTLIESGIPKEKIYHKPIGVFSDLRKFKPAVKKDKVFRAIYVGQVSFSKGVHYLLEAWEKVSLENAKLIICGKVDSLFKKTFKKYFNNSSIKFLGHVDPLPYLQQSNVFCFPSLSEGCPQAIVEAMACGLPVIATENSGSLARHRIEGFVVPIRNGEAFVKCIRYLYDNPSQTKKMGLNSIKRAKNFAIQKYAQNTADLIEDAYQSMS